MDAAETPMKRCTKCGEEKPATPEFFHRNKRNKDGFCSQCKICTSTRMAERYADNRKNSQKPSSSLTRAKAIKRYLSEDYSMYHEGTLEWRPLCRDEVVERLAKWRKDNPDKMREYAHRRNATERMLPATFTSTDWTRSLEYFGHCCAVCGRQQGLWHTLAQDHWIPVSKGGGYTPDNIIPLCHGDGGCNNSKNNHDAHEWLVRSFGARKAVRIEKRVREYFAWVAAQSGASAA